MSTPLKAPFVWFGGKSKVAPLVWPRFGDVVNYCEPFFGSGAMLLGRPAPFTGSETVNDLDGLLANFWRACTADPDAVAHHADWPVNENDLHARHIWLVGQKESLQARLEGDPDFYDAKIAGWWCWGLNLWIGSGFCSGDGPWQIAEVDGTRQLVHLGSAGKGVNRQLVHLGNAGTGVNRKRVHLGNAGKGETASASEGLERKRPVLAGAAGGFRLPDSDGIRDWMRTLAERMRRVRVCCGDWERVCGPSVTFKHGLTAVFLDPPYADTADRTANLYRKDCLDVAHRVREWAIANGENPLMRICLCGYAGEHVMPANWAAVPWKARGGYSSQAAESNGNAAREMLWFSPHCLHPADEFCFT